MSILSKEQLFLKAQQQFDAIRLSLLGQAQEQTRIDLVERKLFTDLLALGLTLLRAFVADAGMGDEGSQVSRGERTLQRSDEPHERWYRSVFGKLSILRWVYARGAKKKIEHAPTDARLGLPAGEYSYVLEDWLGRLCVKEPFAQAIDGLGAILGLATSVETAEDINLRMASHAEDFGLQERVPETSEAATIIVATADGTSVPMHRSDRSENPRSQPENKETDAGEGQDRAGGATRRAYVGGVYMIEPFIRDTEEIMNELFREEAHARRPHPEGKRLWAEMAAATTKDGQPTSGLENIFVYMAVDVYNIYQRYRERELTLVCLMDGESKLWELQQFWLGRSISILDFLHALSRVRLVSKIIEPADGPRREVWVAQQAQDLLDGKVDTVIRRWRRLARQHSDWTKADREIVRSAIGYYSNNRERMRYDEYLAAGYPIGSGVAEGACRNLVKDRMDGSGMHWRLPGARAMLKTRALYLNGEWDDFVEFRIQREQKALYQLAA